PQDDGDGRPLFSPPPDFAPGKVVSEEIFSFDAGDSPRAVTAFTLSNGARVVLCPTDFKANSFLFTALDRGGSSLLGDEDALSAAKAPDYLELSGLNGFPQAEVGKKLAGTQITIYPQITQSYAALTGSAASSDLETYFQLINLYFSAPYFTESAWDRLISDARNDAGARKSSPEAVFVDEVLAYIYGPSVRFKNLTEETIGLLRADRAEKAYRDFFANPGDFTFVFTGDLSLETLRDLSARYIGSLPAAPASASEARAVAPSFPKGRTVLRVRKGLDAQGEVLIVAGDEKPPQVADIPVEQELVAMAENLAQVRLREALREKTGGVYGVSVGISLWNYPARRFLTQIFFGCDPDRTERLAAITEEELGKLRDAPPAAEEIAMLRETFVRQRETARRENDFWHNALVRNIAGNRARDSFAAEDAVLKALTPETLRRICGIYLNTENAVTGILTPE
ncbi:MAG: insulinase family protein, partial [Spirochaetaceae bacterium]|nr:insulinase family protein [Spirochaetaceae bacterium]